MNPSAETMCGYISTTSTENNWKTSSCFDIEAFACTVSAGQSIHPVPKPDNPYKCPSFQDRSFDWQLNPYNNKCYLFPRDYYSDNNYLGGYGQVRVTDFYFSVGSLYA